MPRTAAALAGGAVAAGACHLAARAFVPAAPGAPAARAAAPPQASRLAAPAAPAGAPALPAAALAGLAGAAAAAASAARGRTARRAEPVSAAAGAAAAAKAAAAAGAAKTAGAVAGSAGAGSLAQQAGEADTYDPALDRKFSKLEVGSPEYKKSMEQKRKRNEMAWEAATGRNPDGVGGDASNALKKGYKVNDFDPFTATDGRWNAEASAAGTYTSWDPAGEVGAQAPLGYFDPAGFTTNEPTFRKLRTAEIKHGRVGMMAALGAVVQHYVQIPGFEGIPKGLGAVNVSPGKEGAIALILVCGGLELAVWTDDESKEPGNFGDPLGLGQYTEDMRAREINNGRFAMFAAIGIIAAELLTGKDAVEQLGL